MSVKPSCRGVPGWECPLSLWRTCADDTQLMSATSRRPITARILIAILAGVVSLGAPLADPGVAFATSLSDQVAAARKRQKEIQSSLERQKELVSQLAREEAATRDALAQTADSLKEINADQVKVRERIERASEALARVEARHALLLSELRELDFTIGLLEQELASGQQDLESRRQALGQRLAEAYRTQNTSLLEQVLTADSFADVVSDTSAYLAYGEQDAQLAAAIAQDQQALDSLRLLTSSTRIRTDQLRRAAVDSAEQIAARKAELAKARAALARLEAKTKRLQERQRARFQTIARNKKAAQRLVARQAAEEARLRSRIAGLVREAQRRAAARAGGGSGSGDLMWPARGYITQEYGCTGFSWEPPRGGCAHFHDGIDIAGPSGTPIRAAAAGVIAFVGWNTYSSYDPAFIVVMGHANGLETFYGHLLPRYAVKAGQYVRKGQVIGYMGNTGYSTGTHLHWEVIRNGVQVNPRAYL